MSTSDEEDPRLGATIDGKYRVDGLVGRGGMGAVYRATRLELGEPVAIKFLHPMFAATPELLARFRREAVALARLRHRCIVSLLDFGAHGGEPYMAMELVSGRSLAAIVREGAPSVPFITTVFDQLLEVLEVAHAAGIVHRDVKPSNVMVVGSHHVKLLDFGLVQLPGATLEKLTESGMIHGTPDYMSPEQCEGKETGPATDVYAVGVMLYECLAGDTPFDGDGAAQLMAQHLFVDPPPLASRGAPASAPRALEDLVRRALAKAPDARPSAEGMRAELAAIMRGTDPLSVAEGASRERARVAALSRSERAVTGRVAARADRDSLPSARVALCVDDERRASAIRSALAVAGIGALPPGETAGDVVVVSAREGLARVRVAVEGGARVIVVDVSDVDQTRECIRAGASDMLVSETADSELAPRVARVLRTKRGSKGRA